MSGPRRMTSSKDRTCKQFRDKPPGPPGARNLFTPLVQAGRHTALRSNTAIIFWSASLTEVGLILGLFFIILGDSGKFETGYADARIGKNGLDA